MQNNKSYELRKRLLFTISILAIYLVGRSLLLYGVDSTAYNFSDINSQNLLLAMVSGDRYQCTFFALGIMPAITSDLIVQFALALRSSEYRARFSPQKVKRISRVLLIFMSGAFAVSRAQELIFKDMGFSPEVLKAIAVAEMVMGAVIIYKLADINKDHGIGGQSVIILVNIVDNLASTIKAYPANELRMPMILCCIMMLIIYFAEKKIIKIPVQRVSIHNSYADQDYIGFKLNPIGVMPVMFAVTFFMIPQLILELLIYIYGNGTIWGRLSEKMNLMDSTGILVYLSIIILLDVLFSFVLIAPGDMAEQLQKGGDSIVNVYAGKKTNRYLKRTLLILSILSGLLLSVLMGLSLHLALNGRISSDLALLPSTAMLLVGLVYRVYEEIKIYVQFDSYRFFI